MRTVVLVPVVLTFLAMPLPTSVAADECTSPGAFSFCQSIPLDRPTLPGALAVPPSAAWGKYYLWIGAGHCFSPSNDCRSAPFAPSPGIPTGATSPVPSHVGAGLFGVLFQESNNIAGLQRSQVGVTPPDRMVLI